LASRERFGSKIPRECEAAVTTRRAHRTGFTPAGVGDPVREHERLESSIFTGRQPVSDSADALDGVEDFDTWLRQAG
jgi:hypothetical protein